MPASESHKESLHLDVAIIGAGLSGIASAYHVQHDCPGKSFAILESRGDVGGTWDLFRYPGIRSDSDMYTLGFSFYPWKDPKAIADGPAIMDYIRDTIRHFNLQPHIRFHHKVIRANWESAEKRWRLDLEQHPEITHPVIYCRFLMSCTGYYDYEKGYLPHFPGQENFQGRMIHPQFWTDNVDYTDKRVVVIGSGATAVTIVPEFAKRAASVVMVQRSPTYVVNLPREDAIANAFKRWLPARWAHGLSRWKNILFTMGFYQASRRWPQGVKRFIQKQIRKELGEDFDMRHFDPAYNPWDQRLCMIPDSDLFLAIRNGSVRIVTGAIQTLTTDGITMESGEQLPADLLVTATGLQLKILGGIRMSVDGMERPTSSIYCYKGVMFDDVPNFAVAIGYTNASWTLKCDLNARFVTRVLQYMNRKEFAVCTPRYDPSQGSQPLLDFDAGYIQRARDILPKQGKHYPWKVYQNYLRDLWALRYSKVSDGSLEYSR